jgi:beta-N-acetylhexosaminidase
MPDSPRAVIFGCEGPAVTDWERGFFRECDPLGFILFARNCQTPDQVRTLVADLRGAVGRRDAPVLIDQEGGRVARLTPPHWRAAPAAARFGALYARDRAAAREAVVANARLIAAELAELGITVDCAPVLDLPIPGADAVIGDRAFAADPAVVAALGRAFCEGLLAGAVLPVVKHLPGHGRALADSHLALPVVEATRADLEGSDFRPFRDLADAPWAMTAHIVYRAIDPDNPATTSARLIHEVIREDFGFDGVLVSDDLSMAALRGDFDSRAAASLAAGCDLVLHCNGEREEMMAVAGGAGPLTHEAARRVARGEARRLAAAQAGDVAGLRSRLDILLGGA